MPNALIGPCAAIEHTPAPGSVVADGRRNEVLVVVALGVREDHAEEPRGHELGKEAPLREQQGPHRNPAVGVNVMQPDRDVPAAPALNQRLEGFPVQVLDRVYVATLASTALMVRRSETAGMDRARANGHL